MVNKKKSAGKLQKKECSLSLFSIDDYQESVPAVGYFNGTTFNSGSCGNSYYWSSTPNSNTNNAYNLKFDSGSHNTNNNNRNNGYSVRPVRE